MMPNFSGLDTFAGVVAFLALRRALVTRALTSSSVISRLPPVSVDMRYEREDPMDVMDCVGDALNPERANEVAGNNLDVADLPDKV